MIAPIASAPAPLSADFNVQLVLICAGIVVAAVLLASIPIALARHHRNRETILAILIVWSLATAGSISYHVLQKMNWSADHERQIESGYYDPQNLDDQPHLSPVIWIGATGIYLATFLWAIQKPKSISKIL